jgi:hypothetical protein
MAIPNAMRYRIAKLEGLSKQKLQITPNSGQTAVTQGQTIIVDLPYSSLCDLASFEMKFTGKTNTGPSRTADNTYQKVYYFPRYIQSLLQAIEIRFNNKTVQHIVDYNMIYNTLADLTMGNEGAGKKNSGENYDPSKKFIDVNGVNTPLIAYPHVAAGATNAAATDEGTYVIRNWLGLLGGNASTTCVDTNIIGTVQIRITLAPASVLFLGRAGTNNNTDTPSDAGYTLSDVQFSIMKYDMPQSFFDEVRRDLMDNATFSIYYPHYNTFYGLAKNDKSQSTRFSISSQSLDYLVGTFLVANRETSQLPYSTFTAFNDNSTHESKVNGGSTKAFNQSVYFQRNGQYLATSQWDVGGSRIPAVPEDVQDCLNSSLQAFNLHTDTLGGCHNGMMSTKHFEEAYFTSILSLQWSGESDGVYFMSGLNTKELPISISWNTVAKPGAAVLPTPATFVVCQSNGSYGLPFIIAAETKQVNIKGGRMIEVL